MTEQIGRVLGGRYRLLAPLGAGASAEVYLADDVRLRRRVAVKILHAALADDETFLRRFRAEAQAAAALNHPHILAIYDWNGDEGAPYLVTEYLSGGSLRSMLDAGYRLTRSQALVVGLEAARALDYAHRQGFVHRDVKPANLLFGDDARLRIADFGLARAIAEAAWTEPEGAVLGTARYASPEQARGLPVDGRSDVYSLALVLVEAVTGVVPFTADTTIATLMARLDRPLEVPDDLGPLRPVLEQAGRPEHDERLDADGLGRALVAAAEHLPRPAPLPLAGTAPAAVSGPDPRDPTLLGGTTTASVVTVGGEGGDGDATTVAQPVTGLAPGAQQPNGSPADRTEVLAVPPPGDGTSAHGPTGTGASPVVPLAAGARRRRRWLLPLVVLVAVALGVVVALVVQRTSVPSHAVPQALVGAQQGDLPDYVGEYGWRIAIEEERRDGTETGEILRTDPEPGSQLREGETLTVVVSLGASLVDVPQDLAGLREDEARERLAADGTELVAEFVPEASDEVDEGRVIRLGDDVGEQAPKGSTVQVIVSSGPPPVTVPDLAGWSYDDAVTELEELGVSVERSFDPDADGDGDEVVRTEPGPGAEVERDGTVTVVVAGESAEVPNVIGMDVGEAKDELEDAGLRRGEVFGPRGGEVFAALPLPGSVVDADTRVRLFTN